MIHYPVESSRSNNKEVRMASFQEIEAMWAEDCIINQLQLFEESAKIPKLHHKYHKIYTQELFVLRQKENDMKILERDLFMYYDGAMTGPELIAFGRKPWDHKVMKADIPRFISADSAMIDLKLKYAVQDQKCSFLKSILDSLKDRNWTIKNMQDWRRFEAGG